MARIPECGHPDKKHKARGMCLNCYAKATNDPAVMRARAKARYDRDPEVLRERSRQWRLANPEKAREVDRKSSKKRAAAQREWWKNNPEKALTYSRGYEERNREKRRAKKLWVKYRLTKREFDHMLERQHGVCAICIEAPAIAVDHNHQTGKVRALLCTGCNQGLGLFREQQASLFNAIEYLSIHGANPVSYQKESKIEDLEPEFNQLSLVLETG